mgnify:CR=1 FL=1
MTVCSPAMYTILDAEYDIDTLRDVASHGLASGCGGFIYTSDNVRVFDENDDEMLQRRKVYYRSNRSARSNRSNRVPRSWSAVEIF